MMAEAKKVEEAKEETAHGAPVRRTRAERAVLKAEYARLGMMLHNLWKVWRKLS